MKKFGLLGEKLGHSYSKIIHNCIFELENIDATYELIECSKDELSKYIELLKSEKYNGFNVTIPYKKEIMKYLDEISTEALKIGSVNTVAFCNGKAVGYNTDYYGFLETLNYYNIDCSGKDCYILGTGGASLAVKAAITTSGGNPIYVSRNKDNKENTIDYNDLEKIEEIDILINTTPVGMYPNVDDMPININICKKVKVCVDIIFNPKKTKLLDNVEVGYNGLYMLIGQAVKAEEIWHNKKMNVDYLKIEKEVASNE